MADHLFAYGSKPGSEHRGRLVLADGAWLAAASLLALAVGTVGDRCLRQPALGWHFQPVAERILNLPSAAGGAISLISLEEMQALVKEPGVMVVDARPGLFFEMGHLPGARSLPRDNFEAGFGLLEPALRKEGISVVVYCTDPGCEDGGKVARLLQERGVKTLSVFAGGYTEWEAAGLPVEVVE